MEVAHHPQSAGSSAAVYRTENGVPGISQKVLTDNLRAMEGDGIVSREVFAEVPPRVIYSLTDIGQSLLPIIDAMADWGNSYKHCI